MKYNYNYFAANLEYYMGKNKITQKQIAKALLFDEALITRYKKGTVIPSEERVSEIADFLGISLDKLLEPRSDIDNLIDRVDGKFKDDNLTDEEMKRYSLNIMNAIPNEYLNNLIDNKVDEINVSEFIIRKQKQKIRMYILCVISIIVASLHNDMSIKILSMIITASTAMILLYKTKNNTYIDKIVSKIYKVCLFVVCAMFVLQFFATF